jgi:hypothetical protein
MKEGEEEERGRRAHAPELGATPLLLLRAEETSTKHCTILLLPVLLPIFLILRKNIT